MKKAMGFSIGLLAAAALAFGGTITVTQPAGGSLALGAVCPVHWTASGVTSSVKVQLVKSGGALVGLLAGNLAAGASPFQWTVAAPAAAGEQYRIRVRASDGSAEGMSAVFSVTAGAQGGPSAGVARQADLKMTKVGPSLNSLLEGMKPPDLIPSCTASIGNVNTASTFSLGLKNLGNVAYNRQTCDWIKFYYWGPNGTTTPSSILDMVKTNLPFPIAGGATHSHVVTYTFTQKGKYTYRVYVNPPECQDQHGNEPDANLLNNGLSEKVFWIE